MWTLQIVTVRTTAFEAAATSGGSASEEAAPAGEAFTAGKSEFVGQVRNIDQKDRTRSLAYKFVSLKGAEQIWSSWPWCCFCCCQWWKRDEEWRELWRCVSWLQFQSEPSLVYTFLCEWILLKSFSSDWTPWLTSLELQLVRAELLWMLEWSPMICRFKHIPAIAVILSFSSPIAKNFPFPSKIFPYRC